MKINYEFGSDNHSGVHPDIMKAIESVNVGYSVAYGDDEYTTSAVKKFKEHFGKDIDVYFVGNGTAANILGLKSVTNSFNSIFCAETAHMNVHECCGPEKFTGCKLTVIPTLDGKLTVDLIKPYLIGFGDPHMAQPKVISITQATECGTVYLKEEIKDISDFAHRNKMLLHMDGARLCNAAVGLNVDLAAITRDAGVDVLSFGGTKNGMMFGDAVIFFDKDLSKNFEFIRKQGMHLTSKMRYISAQFEALLSNDLWLKNAKHANEMAQILFNEVINISGINITQKVQVNAVFASLPKEIIKKIQKKYGFHVFNEQNSEVRWMCSFNTSKKDVMDFVEAIKEAFIK
ncbi:MAG: aminotransferase class V-fold PLP-dependent enzyme [Thermoplasmatales archaeon]|nr:MAG: aminotransferase class V-fold PLP-dependent enzyme [Thermoplasmatales archaeon]